MATVSHASGVGGVGAMAAEMEDLTCFIIYVTVHWSFTKKHFQTCLQNVSDQ